MAVIESERVHVHSCLHVVKAARKNSASISSRRCAKSKHGNHRNDTICTTIESTNNFVTHSCRVGGGTAAGQSVPLAELLLDHLQLAL